MFPPSGHMSLGASNSEPPIGDIPAGPFGKTALAGVTGVFVLVVAVTRPAFEETSWGTLLRIIALLCLYVAIVGRAWCSLYIGHPETPKVVARGPYSVSRNPVFLFTLLGAFGLGALTGSLVLAFGALGLAAAIFWPVVLREEQNRQALFSEDYAEYCTRTPRFWPRWSAWRDTPRLEIHPPRFVATIVDGSTTLVAAPILWALASARAAHLIPSWFVLP